MFKPTNYQSYAPRVLEGLNLQKAPRLLDELASTIRCQGVPRFQAIAQESDLGQQLLEQLRKIFAIDGIEIVSFDQLSHEEDQWVRQAAIQLIAATHEWLSRLSRTK